MFEIFLLVAFVILPVLVLLFGFTGCTVLFRFEEAQSVPVATFHVRIFVWFDPSLAGEERNFDVMVNIVQVEEGEDLRLVPIEPPLTNVNGPAMQSDDGRIGYRLETDLEQGRYNFTSTVFANGPALVGPIQCGVFTIDHDTDLLVSAELGSHDFDTCEEVVSDE